MQRVFIFGFALALAALAGCPFSTGGRPGDAPCFRGTASRHLERESYCVAGTVPVETVPPVATHWKLSMRTVESYW